MLAFFQIRRSFHNIAVSMTVDCDAGEANVLVKRDRFIVANYDISLRMRPELRDPQKAEAYFSELVDVPGGKLGRLEAWHHSQNTLWGRAA